MGEYHETEVPDGHIAEVVTYLEMRTPPATGPDLDAPWRLEPWPEPDVDRYLELYRAIGTEWLWASRLMLPRAELADILADPTTEVFQLTDDAGTAGMLELSFKDPAQPKIEFFGVDARVFGAGAGRWLMAAALARAFRDRPDRVWLHTCTLDHPLALRFYLGRGFTAYKRSVGVFRDPRLEGVLPEAAGGHAPLIRG